MYLYIERKFFKCICVCVCLYVRMNVYVSAPTCRSMCGGWASEAGVHAGLSIRRAQRIFPPNPIFKNCSFLRSCKWQVGDGWWQVDSLLIDINWKMISWWWSFIRARGAEPVISSLFRQNIATVAQSSLNERMRRNDFSAPEGLLFTRCGWIFY